jgi:hypothetical protein
MKGDAGSRNGLNGPWWVDPPGSTVIVLDELRQEDVMPGIRVLPRKNPLQFLITNPPVAVIDGVSHQLSWGQESTISASAGEHELSLHFPYLGREVGRATVRVQAADPGPLVKYKTPFWMTSKGKVSVD